MVARSFILLASLVAVALATAPPVQLPPFSIAPGVLMPAVNIGHPDGNCTHGVGPGCAELARKMTLMWFNLGGRGIDTAFEYENQASIGAAIQEAIIGGTASRSSIFVTTKIVPDECTQEAALAAVQVDLAQLNITQLDLVLHHFPCDSNAENQAVWLGLAQAKALGLTRTIGVSHYNQAQLEAIMSLKKGVPAVNQCELCVGTHDDATIKFCQDNGITYEAFGALRSVNFTNAGLVAIAKAHMVSVAQVALRWVTQHGCPVAVSPGLNEEYALEDLGLGSFTLTSDEMATLSAI